MYTIESFNKLAYNKPLLIKIDMSTCRRTLEQISGKGTTRIVSFYIIQCQYNGKVQDVKFTESMYKKLEGYSKNCMTDLVYLFSHDYEDIYGNCSGLREYFMNRVSYMFLSEKGYSKKLSEFDM